MRIWRAFLASFSYFSILPSRSFDSAADKDAIAFVPLVGAVIGGVAGSAAYGVYLLPWHSTIAAALVAWFLCIALSGAIHIDGFLDCCDGLFAMATPQRRLEILRDPHHGTYAIVGMAVLSVGWIWALANIAPAALPWILILSGAASRLCGAAAAGSTGLASIAVGVLVAVGLFREFGMYGMAAAAVIVGSALATRWFARRRLGGALNGDCYGAIIVTTEVSFLLCVPLLRV